MNCDPNALGRLASCYRCIPAGIKKEVIIYLLAEIAGVNPDGNELLLKAKGIRIIPGWMKYEVQLYLLCYILSPS